MAQSQPSSWIRPSPPALDGFESKHAYIAHNLDSACDVNICQRLAQLLEKSDQAYYCYTPDEKRARAENIQDGIEASQKVVVLVSKEYLKYEWYEFEKEQVMQKAKARGRACVLVVQLVSEDDELPGVFTEFQILKRDDEDLFQRELFEALSKDVAPRELSMLPRDNFGTPAAWGYFYGYLKIILPELDVKIMEYAQRENIDSSKFLKKLIIIATHSGFAPPKLTAFVDATHHGWITMEVNRAGVENRPYRVSVFKIKDGDQDFFAAGEFETPLLTMYEADKGGLVGFSQREYRQAVGQFYFTLKSILAHAGHESCCKNVSLLAHKDTSDTQQNFHDVLLNQIKDELEKQNSSVPDTGVVVEGTEAEAHSAEAVGSETTEILSETEIPKHVARADKLACYNMTATPRGWALIIVNINFEPLSSLPNRTGANRDKENLQHLFQSLHFKTQVVIDQKSDEMKRTLDEFSEMDHTEKDAFVCCISTHGAQGKVYGVDGVPLRIVDDVANCFYEDRCSSLKGKPKLFFINSCQVLPGNDPECASAMSVQQEAAPATGPISEDDRRMLTPSCPHFFMSYSTLPGSKSYRMRDGDGSFYIVTLREMIKKYKLTYDLKTILDHVTNEVKKKIADVEHIDPATIPRQQLPFYIPTAGTEVRLK